MWQSQNAWWNHEIGEILHVYHAKTVENVYDLRRFFASLSISLNFNTLAWFQVLQLIVGYSGLCLKNQQGAIAVKLITQAQRWASKKTWHNFDRLKSTGGCCAHPETKCLKILQISTDWSKCTALAATCSKPAWVACCMLNFQALQVGRNWT